MFSPEGLKRTELLSLHLPLCRAQLKHTNKALTSLSSLIYTLSMSLPIAPLFNNYTTYFSNKRNTTRTPFHPKKKKKFILRSLCQYETDFIKDLTSQFCSLKAIKSIPWSIGTQGSLSAFPMWLLEDILISNWQRLKGKYLIILIWINVYNQKSEFSWYKRMLFFFFKQSFGIQM